MNVLNSLCVSYNFTANLSFHFIFPVQLSLDIHGGLVPGPPQLPRTEDAQVPPIKWYSPPTYTHPLVYRESSLDHL